MRPVQSSSRVTFSRRSSAVGSSITRCSLPSASSRTRRERALVAQQALGREHDQRPALLDQRLAAQQVEVLGRRGDVRDPDVALGGQRQEALLARAGVLGAGALVAVRQQQGQPRRLAPLGEAGHDELVDRSPVRRSRSRRTGPPTSRASREPGPRSRTRTRARRPPTAGCCGSRTDACASSRCWIGAYASPVFDVVQHQVALAEGAPRGVLAGQPQRTSLQQAATRTPAPPPGPSRRRRRRPTSARFSRCGASLRCTLKPSGALNTCLFSASSSSSGYGVSRAPRSACGRAAARRSAAPPGA